MTVHKTPYKWYALFTVLVFCFAVFLSWYIFGFLFPVRMLQSPTDSISWEKNIQRSSTVGKNLKIFAYEKILSMLLRYVLWGVKFCTSFKILILTKERKLVHFILSVCSQTACSVTILYLVFQLKWIALQINCSHMRSVWLVRLAWTRWCIVVAEDPWIDTLPLGTEEHLLDSCRWWSLCFIPTRTLVHWQGALPYILLVRASECHFTHKCFYH